MPNPNLFSSIISGVGKTIADKMQDIRNPPAGQTTGGYQPQTNNSNQPSYGDEYSYGSGNYSSGQGGYPSYAQGGHPTAQPGYPSSHPCYPGAQPGYPNTQPVYPNAQPGYPNAQPGYPNAQPGYPNAQAAFPPVQIGFAAAQTVYPSGLGAYPAVQGGYPGMQGGYVPAQEEYSGAHGGHAGIQGGYTSAQGGYTGGQSMYPGGGYTHGSCQQMQAGMYGTPSIRPYAQFDARVDAETLRKAMKGIGCNKNKIVMVLCQRSNAQRQQIAVAFKTLYGKDLISDLKSELSGDFEDLILALMDPPAKYDAMQLRKAMEGFGTKESVLIEIMCSRTNAQIHELRSVYRQLYKRELENDLISETSGCFKRLLVSMCAGGRDESMHTDPLKANQDARTLYRAGENRLGTDESTFNAILASQNYAQLRLVFDEYEKVTKHSIEQAINTEFSGDINGGLVSVIACARNRPAYFATLLQRSMAGIGTCDKDLIRLVVSRSEVDLVDIRQEFERIYKRSLEAFINGDCSGAYKDALIALVRGN